METKITWSKNAENNLAEITQYLKTNWPQKVFIKFDTNLLKKIMLLKTNPALGFRSSVHSNIRKTQITQRYTLVYNYSKNIITIIRIKHSSQNK